MAPSHGHHTKTKAQPLPAKENIPPSRAKGYVTTTTLFKQAATNRVSKHRPDKPKKVVDISPPSILPSKRPRSARKAGLGRSILRKHEIAASLPPEPPKPVTHPLIEDLNATLATYRDNVAEASRVALQPAHNDLAKRLADGVPGRGEFGADLLATRFDQVMDLSNAVGKPLGEDQIKVRFRDAKGHATEGEAALGDTIYRFKKLLKANQNELRGLWQEWDEVCQEIADVGADLLEDPSFPTQFGLKAHESLSDHRSRRSGSDEHVAALREEIGAACGMSLREVGKEAQQDKRERKAKRDQWLEMLKREF